MANDRSNGHTAGTLARQGRSMREDLRSMTMVGLTAAFVFLYIFVFAGWISGPGDEGLLDRVEVIVFTIVGYYFGRVPSEKTEKNLAAQAKEERQLRHTAERHGQQQEIRAEKAEEKIESARRTLTTPAGDTPREKFYHVLSKGGGGVDEAAVRQATAAALRVLE